MNNNLLDHIEEIEREVKELRDLAAYAYKPITVIKNPNGRNIVMPEPRDVATMTTGEEGDL